MNQHIDPTDDHLLEQARERLAKYREMRGEQFLGDGWTALPAPRLITARVDHEPADRIIWGECPECGAANKRFHRCPAKG